MSLEGDIVDRGLADVTLTALIGTRIYCESAPQDTDLPYVTFQIISTNHVHTMVGSAECARSRIQFDAWATKPSDRDSICEALRQSYQRHNGVLVAGGTHVFGSGWTGPANTFIEPESGGERGTFRGLCEAMMSYSVPALS